MAEAKNLGITEWYELVPIETCEKECRKVIRNYDIRVIENDQCRVVAAPEFGGRIISIANKKSGKNSGKKPWAG